MAQEALPEFELARKRAQQQVRTGVQEQQDALARRFSAQGGLQSGAFLKTQQQAAEKGQETLAQANEGINAQESSELNRRKEVQQARDFAAQEAEKQRGFVGGEAEKQRTYGTQERLGQQQFGAEQASLLRAFSTQERLGGQDFQKQMQSIQNNFIGTESAAQRDFQKGLADQQLSFQRDVFDSEKINKLRELTMADQKMAEDRKINAINAANAALEADVIDKEQWPNYVNNLDPYFEKGGSLSVPSKDQPRYKTAAQGGVPANGLNQYGLPK